MPCAPPPPKTAVLNGSLSLDEESQGNPPVTPPQKKVFLFVPAIPGKQEKNAQKNKEILARRKTRNLRKQGRTGLPCLKASCPLLLSILVVRIARPESLAIWHRGRSHRRPNRSGSPKRRHFASLDLKKHPDFRIAGQHRRIFAGFFFL